METDTVTIVEYNVYCGEWGYMNIGVLNCLDRSFKTKEEANARVDEIQHNIDAGISPALYVYMKEKTRKIPTRWANRR